LKNKVWDSVGNTPLIYLQSVSEMTGNHIYGKAEFLNPGGSIKDRAAKGIIARAEKDGSLQPGGTIVEGTAGNTGIGLITLAAERGYKVILTMPNNQAQEKYELLEALGAEIVAVPPCPFKNQNHFYHQARALAAGKPNSIWADQFENTANCMAHYETTGPELWGQTGGKIDILVSAVGTGGTLGGSSHYLKERDKNIKVVAVDPTGSGVYNFVKNGAFSGEGSSITEGIGIMRLTQNLAFANVDDAIQVSDQNMMDMLFHLSKQNGLFVGTSSALNVYAAYKIGMKHQGQGKNIVTFLCDHGSRYASKLLNNKWLDKMELHPNSLV